MHSNDISGEQEQIDSNIYAEWTLNGESSPNANPVPIIRLYLISA